MTTYRYVLFLIIATGLLLGVFILTALDKTPMLLEQANNKSAAKVAITEPVVKDAGTMQLHDEDAQVHIHKKVLRVLCWEEYFELEDSEDVVPLAERSPILRAFMQQENCRIEYQEYSNRWNMIENAQSFVNYYDCIMMPAELVPTFVGLNRICTLETRKMRNLRHIDEQVKKKSGDLWVQERFAPYAYGTTGLLYRRSAFKVRAPRLKDMFEPSASLIGRIGLLDEAYITYLFAFLHLGVSPELAEATDVDDCTALMEPLFKKGAYSVVSSDTDDLWDALVENKIDVCPMWAGDAVDFIEQQEEKGIDDYAYVVPNEGGEFWIDGWVIMTDAPNPKLANKFINYLFEPSVHADFAGYIYYAAPSQAARDNMPEDYKEQLEIEDIYPSSDLIESLSQVNIWLDKTRDSFDYLKDLLPD